MGFFSWKTSDTKESIRNCHVSGCRTVYLLQPNGLPPIREDEYDGYGTFGGVVAYVWLAQHNLPESLTKQADEDELEFMGIDLEVGRVAKLEDGTLWSVFHDATGILKAFHLQCMFAPQRWDEVIPELGASMNALIDAGKASVVPVSELVSIKCPLKFSFSEKAVYEDLPAAEICPNQGYF